MFSILQFLSYIIIYYEQYLPGPGCAVSKLRSENSHFNAQPITLTTNKAYFSSNGNVIDDSS